MKRLLLHVACLSLLALAGFVGVRPDGGEHCAGCIPHDNTVTVSVL